jgi:hypothetical protein
MEGEEPGALKPKYTEDGLHPNGDGLLIFVQEIAKAQYPEWVENWEGEKEPVAEMAKVRGAGEELREGGGIKKKRGRAI